MNQLFPYLLGLDWANLDQRAQRWPQRLHLAHKVQVMDGKLSTLNLSFGQRKRLALLTAYLEERPVYVFDEWAAGQRSGISPSVLSYVAARIESAGQAGHCHQPR